MENICGKFLAFLAESPGFTGALVAALVAFFRVLYDGKEKRWQRILLEGLMLGCMALASKYVFVAFNLNPDLAIVFGTCVGFIGYEQFRTIFVTALKRKAGDVDPIE